MELVDHDTNFAEGDEYDDEGDLVNFDEDEDLEEEDDPAGAAAAFFAAHHRRAGKNKYSRKPFAELPGGEPQELTEAVHKLLEAPATLSEPIRKLFVPEYNEWLALLHAGFSLLLHGVGSKKELIEDFVAGFNGPETPVVVLQGYSSGARVRDLLLTLLTQVVRVTQPPAGSTRALCKQLRQAFAAAAPPAISSPVGVEQMIHLIASCSHRHTAVMWDARKARALNWAWREAATMSSYTVEATDTIHELLGCLYESAVGTEGKSAQVVLSHLTPNAQKLFNFLIGYQLDNPRTAGLSFADLYQKARGLFLATSETSLKKHINEFTTHDLVRTRSGPGGVQVYYCHFPRETLQALQAQASA